MKKIRNLIFISLLTIIIGLTTTVKAEVAELDLQTVGDLVLDKNPYASSFYIVGKYVFTLKYVGDNSLNAADLMIAAQSITLTGDDGAKVKGTQAYKKMSVYQITSKTDDDGNVTGWTVDKNLFGTWTVNDNTKFEIDYIDYEAVKDVYTVTFKTEDGNLIETQNVISGKKANPPKPEDKVGYDFKGWYKDSELIDFSSKLITEDLEVKQKYEVKHLTVTFDKDNGDRDSVTTETVDYNNTVSDPGNPTKDGYNFKGWHKCLDDGCTKLEESNFEFTTHITEDTKLKAKWEIKKFTVTFDSDNSKSDAIKSVEVEYNKTVSELKPEPTRDGYKFLGWYKCTSTENCDNVTSESNKFNFSDTKITGDIKLKAKWEQIIRHVTFKAIVDGKEDDDFYQSGETLDLTSPFQLTEENKPTLKTPDGYDFVEWRVNDKKIGIPGYYVNDEEVTVTGIWKIKQFEVSFDTDGGEPIGAVDVKYGATIPSPGEAVKTSKDKYNGYQFEGWYKCQDDNCNSLDEAKFDFESTPIKENTKLKAKYTNKVYTNQVVANFVDSLPTNNIRAYVDGDTKITFAIKDGISNEKISNTNFLLMVNLLNEALKVKNINNITIDYNDNQNVVLISASDATEPMQNFFHDLTSIEYSNIKFMDLNNKKFKITVNLDADFTDEEGDSTDVYEVEFTSGFVTVKNETELNSNLNSEKEIIIDKENWTGGISDPITINNTTDKPIVIDGSGKTIDSTISNSKYTFIIKSGEVVIKDLTLNIDILKPDEYDRENIKAKDEYANKNTIGIKVESGANLTVNNFHVQTKDKVENYMVAGQALNASSVPINQNAAIELHGTLYGSNVSYDSEIYGSPTILVNKESAQMNIGKLNSQGTHYSVIRKDTGSKDDGDNLQHTTKDFTNYYTNYNNSYLVFAWYNSDKSSIRPFTFLYGEKLILPKLFDVDGDDYNWIKNGENYQLTAWNIRHNAKTTHTNITSDALKEVSVQDRETYYIYTLYSKVS